MDFTIRTRRPDVKERGDWERGDWETWGGANDYKI
jgi:hypothetical protein